MQNQGQKHVDDLTVLRATLMIVVVGAIAACLFIGFSAQKAKAQEQHAHGAIKRDHTCRLGDFLCNHAYYGPVYVLLELITGKSCCHNSEGRPTRDIEDLDPKMEEDRVHLAAGFRYKAWVDGMWCPAKDEALLLIPPAQKVTFMSFKQTRPELFYSFMEYDHAFAPKAKPGPDGRMMCPHIYCLHKKFPPG